MKKTIDHLNLVRAQQERRLSLDMDYSSADEAIEGEFVSGNNLHEMDSPVHPAQDLRFGGEDLSGISEWSMRAHSPELDDGLDAGDIKRSDSEILNEAWQSIGDREKEIHDLEIAVRGAEVFIQGRVKDAVTRESVVNLLLTLPGVRNVYDGIVVSSN